MSRGVDIRQIRALAALQDVLKRDAANILAVAQRDEDSAFRAASVATELAREAGERWYEHHCGDSFVPERGAALATVLLDRERDALSRDDEAVAVRERRMDLERGWRLAEARASASDRLVASLGKQKARRDDERRLAYFSDHISFVWMTR